MSLSHAIAERAARLATVARTDARGGGDLSCCRRGIRNCILVAFALVRSSAATEAVPGLPIDPKMSFFVTSVGVDGSADFGGLAGADRHCRELAAASGFGARDWRAYLSLAPVGGLPGVDARDRIGRGPWFNARGERIADSLDTLFGGRDRIDRRTALDETGAAVPGSDHDILTGSDAEGRLAYAFGVPATCVNWTSRTDGHAMMGHHDRFLDRGTRFPRWRRSWTAAHPSRGCDAARIRQTGSAGRFYCFAADSAPERPSNGIADSGSLSFRRGVNLAHWLSANYLPDAPYAADWMGDEDVDWIAENGFDHIRVRVAGDLWIGPDGELLEERIAPFDRLLLRARERGLGVVLTMFSMPGYHHGLLGAPPPGDASSPFTDPEALYDHEYVWWKVARRFANEGVGLRFELLHRPRAPEEASMRRYNEALLAAVRESNPMRVIYLTSREMNLDTLAEVMQSDKIAEDWNVALAFEFNEPTEFTRQFDEQLPLVHFPSATPDAEAEDPNAGSGQVEANTPSTVAQLIERLDRFAAKASQSAWGRELYLAEFGVYRRADDESTKVYLRAVRDAAERHGWSWSVYDYNSGCAVRDGEGRPTRSWRALFE
jgi:hypothetical protein